MKPIFIALYLLAALLSIVTLITEYYIFIIIATIIYFVNTILCIADLIEESEKNNKII